MAHHSNKDIEAAANAIGNQLAAGIALKESVGRMAKLQPKQAEFWTIASDSISRGVRLSVILEEVWPEGIVAAIKAGEESGKIQEVLQKTVQSLRVKAEVSKVTSKLISPAFAFLAGLVVCLFFMIGVIPAIAKSLGTTKNPSLMLKLSLSLSEFLKSYWMAAVAALVAGIFLFITWYRKPSTKELIIELADKTPRLGEAVRSLFFGMWAYQMALLDSAGLPIKQQLLLSMKTMPLCYRDGILAMANDVEKRGVADASDPDKQEENDPRLKWPFYVSTAFMTSHETGRVDQEMTRCAPLLIEEGMRNLTKVMVILDLIAKLAASIMISAPLMGYFSQMADSMTAAFQ